MHSLTDLSSQFGNVLVLAATYTSKIPWLSELVTRDQISWYLGRTIGFLEKIEPASKTAKVDMEILQELKTNLGFGDAREEIQSGTSHSS